MRSLLFLPLLGFLVVGCVELTPGGENVRVVEPSSEDDAPQVPPAGCRSVGPVQGRARSTKPGSPWTGNFAIARRNALNDLRNNAAEAGADTLINVQTSDDFWGVDATADGYDCGAAARVGRP